MLDVDITRKTSIQNFMQDIEDFGEEEITWLFNFLDEGGDDGVEEANNCVSILDIKAILNLHAHSPRTINVLMDAYYEIDNGNLKLTGKEFHELVRTLEKRNTFCEILWGNEVFQIILVVSIAQLCKFL